MTRFARAKGSKASNERVPESATSWQDMKNDLLQKTADKEMKQDETKYTVKTFLNSNKEATKWSEFPFDAQQLKANKPNKKTPFKTEETPEHSIKQKKRKRPDHSESSNVADTVDEVKELDVGKKKKKQKHNVDTTGSSKAVVEGDQKQNQDVGEIKKKNKLNKKKDKEISPDATSNSNLNSDEQVNQESKQKEFDADTGKKTNKYQKGNKGNFGRTEDTNVKGKKSFNKRNDDGEHKRRKPMNEANKIYINGIEIELAYFDGFPIKKEDADRLKELKQEMRNKGVPKSEIACALKLERRKAEKALTREKKKVCFNCRRSGHVLSECPALRSGADAQLSETGICFKCGSTEHTHFECKVTRGDNFKFAQCFICKEQGHIARQCPDNSKGLYPKGGACRICGDVTHLKRDCPKFQSEQEENQIFADTIDDHNIESLNNIDNRTVEKKKPNISQKIIKF